MDGILADTTYDLNLTRMYEYERQLHSPEGTAYMEYLTQDRGLTTDTLRRFHIGAVIRPDSMDTKAQGRICIPHLNARGPMVLRFRSMPGAEGPKYWQPSGSHVGIFNVTELVLPRDEITVTEGEIDAMTLVQCGVPAIGFPGASSWRDYYRHLFDGYRRVRICIDADDSGAGAAFGDKLSSRVPGPMPIPLPQGHDVNSYYQAAGREALLTHLKIKEQA